MTTKATATRASTTELQFASFQVGDLLLGIDIHQVREINRNVQLTPVPHAPEAVRGVINLRGEVVTVVDLRSVLGLPPTEFNRSTRNVIVKLGNEQISLLVDRVADVISCVSDEIDPLPENLAGFDGNYFSGVFKLEQGLLIVLNVSETLNSLAEPVSA